MQRKKIFFTASLMLLLTQVFGKEVKGLQEMKLINLKSQFVVVEVQDGQIKFFDRFLEKQMKGRGILIPPALRSQYNGKAEVRLEDQEFLKAFKELYVPAVFDPEVFAWQK